VDTRRFAAQHTRSDMRCWTRFGATDASAARIAPRSSRCDSAKRGIVERGEVLTSRAACCPKPESLRVYSVVRLIRQSAPHEGLTLGDHASIAVFVLVA
jgi:hypothetical protein